MGAEFTTRPQPKGTNRWPRSSISAYYIACLDQGPDINLRSLHSPKFLTINSDWTSFTTIGSRPPTYPLRMNSQDHKSNEHVIQIDGKSSIIPSARLFEEGMNSDIRHQCSILRPCSVPDSQDTLFIPLSWLFLIAPSLHTFRWPSARTIFCCRGKHQWWKKDK